MSETQKGAARAEETRAEQVPACGRAAELDALADTLFGGHEALEHADEQEHHHHTRAPASHHEHGHHLLQVEDLSVGVPHVRRGRPVLSREGSASWQVISALTISVHAGEIVAVVGASGSGKTLLADAVLGLFEPNATVRGRIWFDGELQDAAGLAALRGNGVVACAAEREPPRPAHEGGAAGGGLRAPRRAACRASPPSGGAVRALRPVGGDGAALPLRAVGRHGAARALVLRAHGRSARHRRRRAHARARPRSGRARRSTTSARSPTRAAACMLITHDIELAPARGRPRGRVQGRHRGGGDGRRELRRPLTRSRTRSRARCGTRCPSTGFATATLARGLAREVSVLEARGITLRVSRRGARLYRRLQPGTSRAWRARGPAARPRVRQDHALPPARRLSSARKRASVLVDGEPLAAARRVPRAADLAASRGRPSTRACASARDAGRGGRGAAAAAGRPGHPATNGCGAIPHELSGRRAAALLHRPRAGREPALPRSADEVSTMLDAVTQAQIWRFLMDEVDRRGIGLVFVRIPRRSPTASPRAWCAWA